MHFVKVYYFADVMKTPHFAIRFLLLLSFPLPKGASVKWCDIMYKTIKHFCRNKYTETV